MIKTTRLVNKKLFFFGLNPLQVILSASVIILAFLIFGFLSLLFTLLPIAYLAKKVATENKKGNPDFFKAFMESQGVRKYYVDDKRITQYIIK